MNLCGKTNIEFRNEVRETLAHHESSFDQIHYSLQAILALLQVLQPHPNPSSINPISPGMTSSHPQATQTNTPSKLKLSFLNFTSINPSRWIYRAKLYFEHQGIALALQLQLAFQLTSF